VERSTERSSERRHDEERGSRPHFLRENQGVARGTALAPDPLAARREGRAQRGDSIMSKWMFAGCISVAAGAILLGGCTADVDSEDDDAAIADAPPSEAQDGFGSPDLVPINQAYCNGFWAKNQGNMTAAATTLRVKYSWQIGFGVYDTWTEYFSVPSLAAGASQYFYYYPEECFDGDGDCDFVMKADSSNLVVELNESNNSLTTSCIPVP
jgi:hypothetical protein